MCSYINVGSDEELTILALTEMIRCAVGCGREVAFDTTKSDGILRKLMGSIRLNILGWRPQISLRDGVVKTYSVFINSQ